MRDKDRCQSELPPGYAGAFECVADQLFSVENIGPISRLVFTMTQGSIGDTVSHGVETVVRVIVPTETLPAITAALGGSWPIRHGVRTAEGLKVVPGGRDVSCVGSC
jgi:hypothetical protein